VKLAPRSPAAIDMKDMVDLARISPLYFMATLRKS